jgi:RNA polymerase sigma-70 factor (ECF subfamily)
MPRTARIALPPPSLCDRGTVEAMDLLEQTITRSCRGLDGAVRQATRRLRKALRAEIARSARGLSAFPDAACRVSDIFRGRRSVEHRSTGRATRRVSPSSKTIPASRASDARSDEQLVVAHRSGDTTALRVLIDRYKGELHGFLTRLVGTRAGADDVFQEAFLQVHLSADNFDEERRFKPWLYTIAANKGRDFLRRQKRRAAISLDAPVGTQSETSLVDLLDGVDLAPGSTLETSDEAGIVKHVVDELPSHFREILLLSYFQKMSYAQISDSLAIPLGTVKSRLHAAVACFAESWKLACARRGIRVEARPSTPGASGRARKEGDA